MTSERRFAAVLGSIWISLIATGLVLFFISHNFSFKVDTSLIPEIFDVPSGDFAPEPMENIMFLSGIALLPLFLSIFYYLFSRLLQVMGERFAARMRIILYPVTTTALFLIGLLALKEDKFFYLQKSPLLSCAGIALCAAITAACYFILLYPGRAGISRHAKFVQFFLHLLSLFAILTVAVFCVFGINSVIDTPIYRASFGAVFHSVVQVYLGKELLIDLVHQYGLYPHFIEPVFRIVGLTVFKFTFFMGVLMAVSLVPVLVFMRKITNSRIIGLLGFMALIHFCYMHGKVLKGNFDPFFQYHPIRFIFPCLSVYLTHEFFRTNDRKLYYSSFVLYSIAVLWNFDTGFVVLASWILVLMFRELFRLDAKQVLLHLVRGIAIFAAVFLAFNVYMYFRYGQVPDYGLFFLYQDIFYIYGYFMLPMPLVHPWNLVISIYVIGIVYSIDALFQREESPRALMIFFLSILGTGLFSYYQGRSHDLVLMGVSFPAVIIMTILADALLSRTARVKNVIDRILLAGMLFFMVFATLSFLWDYPSVADAVISRMRSTASGEPSPVAQRAAFVKQNTSRGEDVLILSPYAGIYHLESETRCPLKIPGYSELVLRDDWRKIFDYINGDGKKKFVVEELPPGNINELLIKNRILNVSGDGRLTVFIGKNDADQH